MSGYIGTQPVPQATQTRQTFVATAAQTSFATAGYSVGYLDTFLNGVKLQDGVDYTATNGSDIVLTVGAALDDTLEVVAYTAFEVLDQTFTGTTTVTDSGAAPLVANRTASDGGIHVFQKDGTTVGSIGSNIGDLTVGTGDVGLKFNDAAGLISPWDMNVNAPEDATIDLGYSTGRFKDLYLSGGVYLGGTGAANKLDDYEEGTFTPTIGGLGGAPTVVYQFQKGNYTKVGSQVHCNIYVQTGSKSGGAGNLIIGGLPFASASTANLQYYGSALGYSLTTGDTMMDCNTDFGRTYLQMASVSSGGVWTNVQLSDYSAGLGALRISVTYQV